MFVYFVRHGESENNAKGIHQSEAGALSKKGRAQAQNVAQRLKEYPLDLLVRSPFERTIETAEIINQNLNLPVVTTELAREIIRPSHLHGLSHKSDESQSYVKLLESQLDTHDWKHSDEESFSDFTTRARNLAQFLIDQEKEHCVVVSHGGFIKAFIASHMFDNALTPRLSYQFARFTPLANTSISIMKYYADTQRWQLITLNDFTHNKALEEIRAC